MRVAICVDDAYGMLFNKRRQSRDSKLCEDLLKEAAGKLVIRPFSKLLFEGCEDVEIKEDPLQIKSRRALFFVEDLPLAPMAERIEEMIIYKWNRRYPADTRLDLLPGDMDMKLAQTLDFKGSSHEKITKERYIK